MNNELIQALDKSLYRFNIEYFFINELDKEIEVIVKQNQSVIELKELIKDILKSLKLSYKVKVTHG